jgi:hypothetical protein
MEQSLKVDPNRHDSVDTHKFPRLGQWRQGARQRRSQPAVGNYNVLLDSCHAALWDKKHTTWEGSHEKFHTAFAAFPLEALGAYTEPQKFALPELIKTIRAKVNWSR